jgi:hypothetical protein
MSHKLYDELYPRLHFLIGTKSNFDSFYNSWWVEKCASYSGQKLSDYYDIFFSRFVAFNSLYNTIISTKVKIGIIPKKINSNQEEIEYGDRYKSTILMCNELSDEKIEKLFKNREIKVSVKKIIDIIKKSEFVITHKNGEQVPSDDLKILSQLQCGNKRESYSQILKLLYNVRCNLFHGSKGYEENQKILLGPLNSILFHVVITLNDAFGDFIAKSIKDTQDEIDLLEKIQSD